MTFLVGATIVLGVPLLFAALGGIVAERSGVLNLGLEGFLLVGVFTGALCASSTGSGVAGVIGAITAGLATGAVFALLVVSLRADQIVTGIAFNIAMLGITSFVSGIIGAEAFRVPVNGHVRVPWLADIPVFGVVFDQHWLAYLAYLMTIALGLFLFRSRLGIKVRASGEHAEAARASGIDVLKMRLICTTASGGIAAIGGAFIAIAYTRTFGENMIDGRGYIAFAIIILGRWRPAGVALAAAVFAFAQGIDLYAQARALALPLEVLQAVPYALALALAAILGRKSQPPAEEGRPLMLSK